tara:strand:+ start:326 stop:2869 length:2544 start_codon:yes stop_codon:yes gene_type:complete
MPKLFSAAPNVTGQIQSRGATPNTFGGAGLQEAGKQITAFGERLKVDADKAKAVKDRATAVEIEKAFIEEETRLLAAVSDSETNAGPGGAGHSGNMSEATRKGIEGITARFGNVSPENQNRTAILGARLTASIVRKATSVEAVAKGKKIKSDVETGLSQILKGVADGTINIGDGIISGISLIDATGISQDIQTSILDEFRSNAALSDINRMLRESDDPDSVLAVGDKLKDYRELLTTSAYTKALGVIDTAEDQKRAEIDSGINQDVLEHINARMNGAAGNGTTIESIMGVSNSKIRDGLLTKFRLGEEIGNFAVEIKDMLPEELNSIENKLEEDLLVEGGYKREAGQLRMIDQERASRQEGQTNLVAEIPNAIQAIADGKYEPEEVEKLRDSITRNIQGDETRKKLLRAVGTAVDQGKITLAVPSMSKREIQTLRRELSTDVDRALGEDRITAEQRLQAFNVAKELREEAINTDSVSYVQSTNEDVLYSYNEYAILAATAEESGDPADQAAASIALDSYVSSMGNALTKIGETEMSLLRVPEVSGIKNAISSIETSPEGARELVSVLDSYRERYGQHWPTVYRQLAKEGALSDGHAALARMTGDPDKQASAVALATALTYGDELKSDGAKWTEVTTAVDDSAWADMSRTLDAQGAFSQVRQYKDAIDKLAMYYVRTGSLNNSDAAKRAYEEVVGNDFHIEDSYRIPVLGPDGQPTSPFLINRGAQETIENLNRFNIVPALSRSGYMDETQQIRSLEKFGEWITSPDGSGLMLVDEQGRPVQVYSESESGNSRNEESLIVKWDELKETGLSSRTVSRPTSGSGRISSKDPTTDMSNIVEQGYTLGPER